MIIKRLIISLSHRARIRALSGSYRRRPRTTAYDRIMQIHAHLVI